MPPSSPDTRRLRRPVTMTAVAEDLERPKGTDLVRPLLPVCALVAVMWVEEIVDTGLGGDLDQYGIVPRQRNGLDGIMWSPFLQQGIGLLRATSLACISLRR